MCAPSEVAKIIGSQVITTVEGIRAETVTEPEKIILLADRFKSQDPPE